jgi:Tfp pilus assembly protein PilN
MKDPQHSQVPPVPPVAAADMDGTQWDADILKQLIATTPDRVYVKDLSNTGSSG